MWRMALRPTASSSTEGPTWPSGQRKQPTNGRCCQPTRGAGDDRSSRQGQAVSASSGPTEPARLPDPDMLPKTVFSAEHGYCASIG